jgi:phosphatidylserine decarboxylase
MFRIRQLFIIANFLVSFALSGCGGEEKTPIITNFSPASGPVGTTVTIVGDHFSINPTLNIVTFNGSAAIVTSSTETEIITTVPAGATTGPIAITHSLTGTSTTNFVVTPVAISSTSDQRGSRHISCFYLNELRANSGQQSSLI